MPPDVLLLLASSGIAFVGALMFFVSDEKPPAPKPFDPTLIVPYALPPRRVRAAAARPQRALRPPTRRPEGCVDVQYGSSRYRYRFSNDAENGEWLIALETAPVADTPALQLHQSDSEPLRGAGAVHDLRWHGRAGLARTVTSRWRQKPADA